VTFSARAESSSTSLVGDHRHTALDVGDDDLAADQVAIARVVRVHGDKMSAGTAPAARSRIRSALPVSGG
jgi:hypothetical protein